ncbi:amino acid adenylation domain-containing protein [Pseudoalteromonas rubra]|nr:amino acid adenylation domain-containing protein [Pseudoalteromonas rubra]
MQKLLSLTSVHDAFSTDSSWSPQGEHPLQPFVLERRNVSCESEVEEAQEALRCATEQALAVLAVGVLAISDEQFWLTLCAPNHYADLQTLQLILAQLLDTECNSDPDEERIQFSEVKAWLDGIAMDPDKPQLAELVGKESLEDQEKQRLSIEHYQLEDQEQVHTVTLDLQGYRATIAALAAQFDTTSEAVVSAAAKLAMRRFNNQAQMTSLVSLREDEDLRSVPGALLCGLPMAMGEVSTLSDAIVSELAGRELLGGIAECFYAESQTPYLHTYYYFSPELHSRFTPQDIIYCHNGGALTHVLFDCADSLALHTSFSSIRFTADAVRLLHSNIASVLKQQDSLPEPWQLSGAQMPIQNSLQSWLEQAATDYPDSKIIEPGVAQCGLAGLHERANKLANYLSEHGVKKGAKVVIWEPRSIAFFTAMLAVTKLGATYVPLNESMPAQRVAAISAQLDATCVITSLLGTEQIGSVMSINLQELDLTHYSSAMVIADVVETDIAYVIFTSGSTGEPKGIEVSYGALNNHMRWFEQTFSVGPGDTLLQKTSAGFDASVWEFWVVLLSGVNCVIAEQSVLYDVDAFMQLVKGYDITLLQVVPSYLSVLLEHDDFNAEQLALRTLFCGGEALPTRSAEQVKTRLNCTLVNLYGPTETCIDATYYVVDRQLSCDLVPIGQPIANVTCQILNGDDKPVSLGESGELVLSGPALFSGYLDNPQATARATYVDEAGVRYYRTGDIVRTLADGNIYYIDRKDNQIKHNGYRIDLSAVSSAAAQCDGVVKAECVYHCAQNRLTLFYKTQDDTLSEDTLRGYLQNMLPAFMIPEHFFKVDTFAMTVNGKVDKKALLLLAQKQARAEYQAPSTEVEKQLAQVWEKVLGLSEKVGINDNFFSLGGDSIKGIKVAYELNQRGFNLSLMEVFDNPTIQSLATVMEQQAGTHDATSNVLPEEAVPEALRTQYCDVYPATGMQVYMLNQYDLDIHRVGLFHPQEVIELPPAMADFAQLRTALDYELQSVNFRTRFVEHEGRLFQVLLEHVEPSIETYKVSGRAERDELVAQLLRQDNQRPYEWRQIADPLVRFYYIEESAGGASLITSNLHAIQDGWGNVTFKNNVEQRLAGQRVLSKSEVAGQPNVLKEFVAQEINEMVGHSATLAYWQNKAAHFSGSRLEKQRPYVQHVESFTGHIKLSSGQQWAKEHSVHFKSVLIAALTKALAHQLGEPWTTLGLISNGRNPALSDPLGSMGLFWNLLPVRVASNLSTREMALQAHAELLEMEQAIRLPLPQQIALHGGCVPFQVTFNYVEFHHLTSNNELTRYQKEQLTKDQEVTHNTLIGQDYFGFPLEFSFSVEGEILTWVVQYDSNDVLGETAKNLIEELLAVIKRAF